MMTQMHKTFLALLLALVLFIQPFGSATVAVFDSSTYRSTYLQGESVGALLTGGALQFTALPVGDAYAYLKVAIKDASGMDRAGDFYSRQDLLEGGKTIDLKSLPDGRYHVEIYTAPELYTYYVSYIYGKNLQIEVTGGNPAFVEPPVYTNNLKVYNGKRTDRHALMYYLKPTSDIQSSDKRIVELAASITSGMTDDYQKTKAIHDWVANNIWYDWDALTGKTGYGDTSAIGTLTSKKSVCQGYASLTAALLRASGIPAKLVSGYALGVGEATEWQPSIVTGNSSNHAWNEAYVDGRWILIDTTWNSNNEYKDGSFSKSTGLDSYRYFDATLEAFSLNHKLVEYKEAVPNWWSKDGSRYYVDNKGNVLKGLYSINNQKYYFDATGIMKTGWQTIGGKKFYFAKDGIMARSKTLTIDGKKYVFDTNGNWKIKK